MPKFFFDIDDGNQCLLDGEGTEFPGLQEACNEAVRILPDIARDVLPNVHRRAFVSLVRDMDSQLIFKATLSLKIKWLIARPVNATPEKRTRKRIAAQPG